MNDTPRPIVLITGGAKRVGRAIALELAGQGFDPWIHCNSSTVAAQALAVELKALGASPEIFQADLSDTTETLALTQHVAEILDTRPLKLIVHNASLFNAKDFDQLSTVDIALNYALHAQAPLLITKELAPSMRHAKDPLVVMMLDAALDRPLKSHAHYTMSKGALSYLVPALCRELAPEIRVVGIAPGQVQWPDHYSDIRRSQLIATIPLGRVGRADEVAKLIRFVSTEGTFINGTTIVVDGGASTVGPER